MRSDAGAIVRVLVLLSALSSTTAYRTINPPMTTTVMNNQTLWENARPRQEPHRRVKRKVIFTKNSKIFFRVNGKLNVVPYNQIFAYGYAVRVNWDLPESLHKRHKFFKRDLHAELEKIQFDRNEHFQTYACLFAYICNQISRIDRSKEGRCGIMCSIGRIINQAVGIEADFFKSILNNCDYYIDICSNHRSSSRHLYM